MSKFELHPVDPGFRAAVDDAGDAATEFASNVMDAMAQLMEKAVRMALVHVPADQLLTAVDQDSGSLQLLHNGRPVYVVTANLLDVEVTVTGTWLDWRSVIDHSTES